MMSSIFHMAALPDWRAESLHFLAFWELESKHYVPHHAKFIEPLIMAPEVSPEE